jgi:hypothetical protein
LACILDAEGGNVGYSGDTCVQGGLAVPAQSTGNAENNSLLCCRGIRRENCCMTNMHMAAQVRTAVLLGRARCCQQVK